jgi:hypothetical protein
VVTDAKSWPGRSDRYLGAVLALFALLVAVCAGRLIAGARGNVTDLALAGLAAALAAGILTAALAPFVASGPSAARRTLVAFALVFLISGVAALASESTSTSIDKTRYVTANTRIVNSLRSLPGAHVISRSDLPYYSGDNAGDRAAGYTTLVRYRLPATLTAAQIASFYRRALHGRWRLIEVIPANTRDGPVLNFVRGAATLSVNLMNERHRQLEISVDHHHTST